MTAETAHRTIGVIATCVGLAAAASPRHLLRVYGIPSNEITDAGTLGWRLFAARNLVIGVGVFAGNPDARRVALGVQALDQVAFFAALRSDRIPSPTAVAAMVTSGAIVALGMRARRAG